MTMQHAHCLGVVLSGGLSSRMGTDKAMLERNNQNMLSFSQELLLNTNVNDVVISGKNHGLADQFENMGPMAGIYTIINTYHPKALLVLPVDLPLMTADALQQLKRVGELSQKICYYHEHFLPFYLPINAFVEQFFQQAFSSLTVNNSAINGHEKRGPSVKRLIDQVPSQSLLAPKNNCLFNTNTPAQWQHAQQQFMSNRKFHV